MKPNKLGLGALLTSDLSMKHSQNLDKWDIEVIEVEQQSPLSDEYIEKIRERISRRLGRPT